MWLVVNLLIAFLVCGLVAGAFALAWDVANTKYRKQVHSITARYEAALRAADAAGSAAGAGATAGGGGGGTACGGGGGGVAALYESFTLGWLNLVVQHLWLPVLEKFVSTLAAERLQLVLNEVLRKNGSKTPWKLIESVAVEEVTFGLAPPQFQHCTAKYDPARAYLLLTMDMHYHSNGFQAVLTPRMRQMLGLRPFSVRLEITQLRLAGRLHLGLHLTQEPPGIKGIDYSFASAPEFDIQASPVGYLQLHGELPGLVANLRQLLQRLLNRRVVEPSRRHLDLQRIYRNKHLQRVGGPGGCLRVCVIGGRNLMRAPAAATPAGGAAAAPAAAAACDPYVEMRYGREVFRTPIAHHSSDPVFNWQFDLRLPADLPLQPPATTAAAAGSAAGADAGAAGGGSSECVLHFRVLNARTFGEPEVLSGAVLDAGALGLLPNGDPRVRLLELVAAGGGGARGTLSLQISWLKPQPKRPSPFAQDAARAAAAAAPPTAASAPAAATTTPVPRPPAPAPSPFAASAAPARSLPGPGSGAAGRCDEHTATSAVGAVLLAHAHAVTGSRPMAGLPGAASPYCGGAADVSPLPPTTSPPQRRSAGGTGPSAAPVAPATPAPAAPSPHSPASPLSPTGWVAAPAPSRSVAARVGGLLRHRSRPRLGRSLAPELTLAGGGGGSGSGREAGSFSLFAAGPSPSASSAAASAVSSSAAVPPQRPAASSSSGSAAVRGGRRQPHAGGRHRRAMSGLLALVWGGRRGASGGMAGARPAGGGEHAGGGGDVACAQHARRNSVGSEGPDATNSTATTTAATAALASTPMSHPSSSYASPFGRPSRAAMAAAAGSMGGQLGAVGSPVASAASGGSGTQPSPTLPSAASGLTEEAPSDAVPVGAGSVSARSAPAGTSGGGAATTAASAPSDAGSAATTPATFGHGSASAAGAVPSGPPPPQQQQQQPSLQPHSGPSHLGRTSGATDAPAAGALVAASGPSVAALTASCPAAGAAAGAAGAAAGQVSSAGGSCLQPQLEKESRGSASAGTPFLRRASSLFGLLGDASGAATCSLHPNTTSEPSVRQPPPPPPLQDPATSAARAGAPTDPAAPHPGPGPGCTAGAPSAPGAAPATPAPPRGPSHMRSVSCGGPAGRAGAAGGVLPGVAEAGGRAVLGSCGGGAASGAAGGGPPPGQWPASLQSLAQVVRMQRLLESERQARAELAAELQQARGKYEAMVRLRRFENHRALMEGARFQLHLGPHVRGVLLWFNEPRGRLQLDPDGGAAGRAAGGATAAAGAGGGEAWPRVFAPQELQRAERGCAAFPSPSAWAGVVAALMGRQRPAPPASLDPLKCFSLCLEGGRCLHLQLPPAGNGRSRDEWLDALQDLALSCTAAREERSGAGKASAGPPAAGQTVPSQAAHTAAALGAGPGAGGALVDGRAAA